MIQYFYSLYILESGSQLRKHKSRGKEVTTSKYEYDMESTVLVMYDKLY